MPSGLKDFAEVVHALRQQFYAAVEDDAMARFLGKRVRHVRRPKLEGRVIRATYEETYGASSLQLTYRNEETGKITTTNITLLELITDLGTTE